MITESLKGDVKVSEQRAVGSMGSFVSEKIRVVASQALLRLGAVGLPTYPRGEAMVQTPSRFRNIEWIDLERNGELFDDLVVCYQAVFGSDEKSKRTGQVVWGEGAYCSKEGWSRLYSLPEYREMKKEGVDYCKECGASLELCYPSDKVKNTVQRELTSGSSSFCTVMEGDQEYPIGGFTWGAICNTPEEVGDRLVLTRYKEDIGKGSAVAFSLTERLWREKIGRVLFFDEMGIIQQFRGGIDPVRFLCRDGFEMANEQGVRRAIFWTSERSNIFRITTSMGFEPFHESDGLVFLLNADFVPLLKIIQNKTEAEIVSQMRKGSRVANI